jgi:hypothetical protein
MSEVNIQQQIEQAVAQALAQRGLAANPAPVQQQMPGAAPGGWAQPAGWGQPAAMAVPQFLGVAVPIKVSTPQGSIRLYLSLPPEALESPQRLMQVLEQLYARGFPLDIWQQRPRWGGQGGQNGRGGYGNGWGGGNRW